MRDILIISLLSFNLAGNAQELTDSAKVHNIDEVVVNATRSYATPDGVVYIPSKEAIRHAFNISDLLARMMVAGLLVDLSSDKVSTTYGAALFEDDLVLAVPSSGTLLPLYVTLMSELLTEEI